MSPYLRLSVLLATTALLAAEQFAQMRFLADHDPLTNLLNRRSFVRELEEEVRRSQRYSRPLALLLFGWATFGVGLLLALPWWAASSYAAWKEIFDVDRGLSN